MNLVTNRDIRGFALATTLLFVSLLMVMLGSLLLVVRTKLSQSQLYNDQTSALYLAELAISEARAELEADSTWVAGFLDQSHPELRGTYSLKFNSSGPPFTNQESINNIDGLHDESHRGPGSVRSGHCLLVATAQVGRATRTIEALVELGGGLLPLDVALLNDGRIVLRGESHIDGIKSLRDRTALAAGIHSNLATGAAPIVDLTGLTGTSLITGLISSSGTSTSAVDLGSYGSSHTAGLANNAALKVFPDIDIVGKIASKASSPPPPLASLGTSVLNQSLGTDFFHPGALNVNGDLRLENVNLYVDGPLTINGSLEGHGSIYVAGKSRFQGTTTMTTAVPDKIALYSHDSVEIKGFDGSAYLTGIGAADPAFQTRLDNYRRHMEDFLTLVGDPSATWGQDEPIDEEREALARGQFSTPLGYGSDSNLMRDLAYLISQLPNTPAQAPLRQKFEELTKIFTGVRHDSNEATLALDLVRSGRLGPYSIDNLIDYNIRASASQMEAFVAATNFDRPGEAFFQGLVYTHGYIHASEEITIVGALAALGTSSGPPVSPGSVGPDTLNPGDVYLLDGSRLLFVEDFFKAPGAYSGPGGEGSHLRLWMGR